MDMLGSELFPGVCMIIVPHEKGQEEIRKIGELDHWKRRNLCPMNAVTMLEFRCRLSFGQGYVSCLMAKAV